MYPSAGVKGPYTLTAVPVGGGTPVAVTCASPACTLRGLSPGMAYTVSATGTDASSGKPTPPSPAGSVVTPSANAPAIDITVAGSSLSADISLSSLGVSGPYTLTADPIGGGKPIKVTCSVPIHCVMTGLSPGTLYAITATATGPSGKPTPPSAPSTITTPLAR